MIAPPESLPHWACVAVVARCAERVLPVFDTAWPDAPQTSRELLTLAIRAALDSAAAAKLVDGFSEVEDAVTRTVGRLLLSCEPNVPHELVADCPPDPSLAKVAADAANVAAKATETALARPGQSYEIAMEGVSWALEAADDDQELVDALQGDLDALRAAASRERWNHKTPVVWHATGWRMGESNGDPWWKFW